MVAWRRVRISATGCTPPWPRPGWREALALSLLLDLVLCALGVAAVIAANRMMPIDDTAAQSLAIKARALLFVGLSSVAVGLGGWYLQRERPGELADLAIGTALVLSVGGAVCVLAYYLVEALVVS